jgi:hypothetical protein
VDLVRRDTRSGDGARAGRRSGHDGHSGTNDKDPHAHLLT